MARDIVVYDLATMLEICVGLTERGHGFEVTEKDGAWRICLSAAF
jgi:hypothetical protein